MILKDRITYRVNACQCKLDLRTKFMQTLVISRKFLKIWILRHNSCPCPMCNFKLFVPSTTLRSFSALAWGIPNTGELLSVPQRHLSVRVSDMS